MKRLALLTILITPLLFISKETVAEYYTFGIGPVGNIFVVDSNPNMGAGVGGMLFFDYRWSPQLSTQVSVIVTTEDGKGPSSGDKGIEFLGIPTFDVKYYLVSSVSKWDPYIMVGVGVYAISEGTKKDGTFAIGIGANTGVGVDYYLADKWSLGLAASFRSIGLIDSTKGSNAGKAIFPLSLSGNVSFHF